MVLVFFFSRFFGFGSLSKVWLLNAEDVSKKSQWMLDLKLDRSL